MKIISLQKSKRSTGYALTVTLVFLAIALAGFGSILQWVSSSTLVTERNNLSVAAQAAAESATENVMTVMMRDSTYGTLFPANTYATLVPDTNGWPVRFIFSDTNGVAGRTRVTIGSQGWSPLPSQFTGLYGSGQNCVIASTATTAGQRYDVSGTVSQSVWFGIIPLFQFAIFYNMDLEINPGAAMTINGRVHSNQNIWATGSSAGSPLIFSTSVDASGIVTNTPSPLDFQNYGHRTGNAVYADPNSPVQNSDSLILPVGTTSNNNPINVAAILNLPPDGLGAPLAAAYSGLGQVYLYNETDLIISNSASGINGSSSSKCLAIYYQNPNSVNPLTAVAPDVKFLTTSNSITTTNYYYSFVTNLTFYDHREGKTVQAVQVNVAGLNAWLTNGSASGGNQYQLLNTTGSTSKGHRINSIFVFSEVDLTASTLPAVRLTAGARLPSDGLTIATPLPIYVKGDYNVTTNGIKFSRALGDTTNTVPASLLGDAITVLSANWSDSYNSGTALSSRTPADTCVNAATLEGVVVSDGSHYSGGVENFLRLLENWSGYTVTYNGSIVVMFPSQYATSPWQATGVYYNAPTRKWGFDLNFTDQRRLPPLTPQVKATIRGSYATQ
jgi:hypothetical protein